MNNETKTQSNKKEFKKYKIIKIFLCVLVIILGTFMIVFGEYDDSPGAQGIGLLMVIGGICGLIGKKKIVKLMENKKRNILLVIIFFIVAITVFIYNMEIDRKANLNFAPIEVDYKIVEVLEEECLSYSDCVLPTEYALSSSCPYSVKCINSQCSIVCPQITEWDRIKQAVNNCNVKSVMQTHARQVTVELKNGDTIEAIEPEIDDIFDIVKKTEDRCGKIILATE